MGVALDRRDGAKPSHRAVAAFGPTGQARAAAHPHVAAVVGDHVDAGEVIGLVGSTGKSTGPHRHFEAREHGMPVHPVPTFGN